MNLLKNPWIPVCRADGQSDIITPFQIVERDNPVVRLDACRADFNGALIQFLIGLLQTTFAPENQGNWLQSFKEPPTPEALQAAFLVYESAFNLDGDGPRFMQDLDALNDRKPLPMTNMLIETAGSETHFVKDLPQQGFSPALAAIALYTFQTNAPVGGAGHRTSMRGGGPLTTLVTHTPTDSSDPVLWKTCWLNVREKSAFRSELDGQPDKIFPWLAATRVSDKGSRTQHTTPEDVHPLQMFWNMPRRIRLDFVQTATGECGLSGVHSDQLVRQFRMKNYGVNYPGELWSHVLSPYTYDGKQSLPLHAHGRLNYRHWIGLVGSADKSDKRVTEQAEVIQDFIRKKMRVLKRSGVTAPFPVWAFGYDMDQMKPCCWDESTMPLFVIEDEDSLRLFEETAQQMVLAASEFIGNLRSSVKNAWFKEGDPRQKGADTDFLNKAFWHDTEQRFYDLLTGLSRNVQDDGLRNRVRRDWHKTLHHYTLKQFDRWANSRLVADQTHPERVVAAKRNLRMWNYKGKIKAALNLPKKDAT